MFTPSRLVGVALAMLLVLPAPALAANADEPPPSETTSSPPPEVTPEPSAEPSPEPSTEVPPAPPAQDDPPKEDPKPEPTDEPAPSTTPEPPKDEAARPAPTLPSLRTGLVVIAAAALNAVDDAYTTQAGTPLIVGGTGVAENDTKFGAYKFSVIDSTDHGTLSFNTTFGSFTYTPDVNFTGTDTFTYLLYDTADFTKNDTATVTITVDPIGPAPVAVNDAYTVINDPDPAYDTYQQTVPGVLGNDANGFVATLVAGPAHGVLDLAADGSFTYQPDDDFFGTTTFSYKASGPGGVSAPATVTLTLVPRQSAADDLYSTNAGDVLTVNAPDGVLANDSGALAATLVTDVNDGDLVLSSDGSFVFTPSTTLSYVTFTYSASGSAGTSDPATVTIRVVPPLIAGDDLYSVNQDQPLAITTTPMGDIGLKANDTLSGGPCPGCTVHVVATTEHGTLTADPFGGFVYVPDPSFHGTDTFTYNITDGVPYLVTSNTATVTIIVNGIASPPGFVAGNDSYEVTEGAVLNAIGGFNGLLVNDTVDGAPCGINCHVSIKTQPTHGTLLPEPFFGGFTYVPNPGFTGTDTFTYRATTDLPFAQSNLATVTITVNELVETPGFIANDDNYEVDEGAPLNVIGVVNGVLINDTLNGTACIIAFCGITVDGPPAHGSLLPGPSGGFSYLPNPGFSGTDTFTYRAVIGGSVSNRATVTITVNPLPDTPGFVANDDNYSVTEGETLNVAALIDGPLMNDTYNLVGCVFAPCTFGLKTQPSHGALIPDLFGGFLYVPAPGFSGTDSFTYRAAGPFNSRSNTATVTITVNPLPVASSDSYSAVKDQLLLVDVDHGVLANDTDVTSAAVGSTPGHGVLNLSPTGAFTYQPAEGYAGPDSFTYTATGPGGTTAPTTVNIMVEPPAPPVATADTYGTVEGQALSIDAGSGVLSNDTHAVSATLVDTTSHGLLSLASDGSFDYVPVADFSGTDTFTYTATGPGGTSAPATVTITVTDNDPVANADSYELGEGGSLTVAAPGVLGNDVRASGARLAGDVEHGHLTLNADGSFTYVPDEGYTGTDQFTYVATSAPVSARFAKSAAGTVVAAAFESDPATVTITVTAASGAGGGSGGASGSDSSGSDSDAMLPDTGSPVRMANLSWALLAMLAGIVVIVAANRRGRSA